MMVFFLGIAWEEAVGKRAKVRSMLVHPSRLTEDHSTYKKWVTGIQKSWARILDVGGDETLRNDLLGEFKEAYSELSLTLNGENLPFGELVSGNHLSVALKCVQIREVNAKNGETPSINWPDSESWILVGGQSMDR